MKIKNLLLLTISVLITACASYEPEKYQKISKEKVLPRASFEMNCPKDQIDITVLSENKYGYPETLGVTGCNQRLVYTRFFDRVDWILNSDGNSNNT